MAVLETRARGEVPAVVERRPATAGPDNRFGRTRPARCHGPAAHALEERRPRHPSAPVDDWRAPPPPNMREGRRNRRAPGASSGGTFGRDKRSRLEWTNVPPVGGDRQIADCSAVNPRHCCVKETICVHLRDLRENCDGRGWVDGSGSIWAICGQIAMGVLVGSVFLCALCVSVVQLWPTTLRNASSAR